VDTGPMLDAVQRAIHLFRDKPVWKQMQQAGMKCDVTWTRSAAAYASLYRYLLKQ
jgi:starch synthase